MKFLRVNSQKPLTVSLWQSADSGLRRGLCDLRDRLALAERPTLPKSQPRYNRNGIRILD
jgi:hypothetical protein